MARTRRITSPKVLSSLVSDFLVRLDELERGPWAQKPPAPASFLHGRTGLAFFYAEHFFTTGERSSLERARGHLLAARASAEAGAAEAFGFGDGPQPFPLPQVEAGVFTGWGGIGYTMVLVGAAAADAELRDAGAKIFGDAFARHTSLRLRYSELFLGTAGYVAASDDLRRRGAGSAATEGVGDEAARLLVDDVATPVAKGALLGAAHGRTGELLALVRRSDRVPERVRARIDELRSMGRRAGGFVLWPDSSGGKVPGWLWSSFCNGAVGQTLLFAEASRAYDDPRYREAAAGAAESVRSLEAPPQATLCCGEAGQAVALHRYGMLLGSDDDVRASGARVRVAASRLMSLDPIDLFQGQAGVALLALRAAARQPLFMPMFFDA
jgi:hypothetical protein